MKKLLPGVLAAASLLLVAAAPAEFSREVKGKTANIQDDLKRLEGLTQEVIVLSRNIEDAADRIKGPNDTADIRIVEEKMDVLKKKTREAVGAADRVEKLATGIHYSAQELVEAKGGSRGAKAKVKN